MSDQEKFEEKLSANATAELLGMLVRQVWIGWAKEHPTYKRSRLVPWENLSERDKDADRRIGMAVRQVVLESARAEHAAEREKAITKAKEGCKLYCKWYHTGTPDITASGMAYELVGYLREINAILNPEPPKTENS